MEQLLHYVWKHRLWPLRPLATTDGQSLDIVDTGTPNTDAGPDFFNAKIRIGGQLWVGNVEIHLRASDWFRHRHHTDPAYDSVALHVVEQADAAATDTHGRAIPTVELPIPPAVRDNYAELIRADRYPTCRKLMPQLPPLTLHSWLAALGAERLERKTGEIVRRVEQCGGAWEAACFVTLARNFGFGANADTFEEWALTIPQAQAARLRDNPAQIEALFMGQSGLLGESIKPDRQGRQATSDSHLQELQAEYLFLRRKYSLTPIDASHWKLFRTRPQNFPHIRLAQLAALFCSGQATLSRLAECLTMADVSRCLQAAVAPYWQEHYAFGLAAKPGKRLLSKQAAALVAINTVAPMLFAYGRHRHDEELSARPLRLLEELPPENNATVRMWRECGVEARSAADSQALLQLTTRYCDRRDCLRCRIGYEYMRKSKEK